MNEQRLKHELAKRIFGQLGVVPGMKLGHGAILEDAIIDRKLSLRVDGEQVNYPVFVVRNSRDERLILANIGDKEEPEMILVAENEQVILGLHFVWPAAAETLEEGVTPGQFWTWDSVREQWVPLSLQHILMLTAAFEDITQSGVLWEPWSDWRPMYDWLVKLADFVVVET